MATIRTARRPAAFDRRAHREGSLAGAGLSLATMITALMVIVAFAN